MNRQELKYIIFSGIFAFVWFMFLLPRIIPIFDGNNPLMQFFLFNISLYAFFFIILKSATISTRVNIEFSFGLLCLFLALDCWMPEYHVLYSGELVVGASLGVSTTDYFFGYIAHNILNFSGILVYLATYVLFPIILLILSAKTIPNFVKHI